MDTSIKISLTMQIPGRTRRFVRMLRKKVTLQDTSMKKLPEKVGARIIGTAKVPLYEYIPAQHHINICKEAYDSMISPDEVPERFMSYMKMPIRHKAWKKLSTTQRLDWHMNEITQHFHAISFVYSVMEEEDCENWRIPF